MSFGKKWLLLVRIRFHIPHQVRKHGIHIFPCFEPAVHVCICRLVPEIICAYADVIPFFLRKDRVPDLQEVFLECGGSIGGIIPGREEECPSWGNTAYFCVIGLEIIR